MCLEMLFTQKRLDQFHFWRSRSKARIPIQVHCAFSTRKCANACSCTTESGSEVYICTSILPIPKPTFLKLLMSWGSMLGGQLLEIKRVRSQVLFRQWSRMSYRRAASTFSILIASLHAPVTNPNRPIQKLGHRKVLRDEEEKLMVYFLVHFAQRGVLLSQQNLREAVETFVGQIVVQYRALHGGARKGIL